MATKKKAILATKKPAAKTAPTSGRKSAKTVKTIAPVKRTAVLSKAPVKAAATKIAKPIAKPTKPIAKLAAKKTAAPAKNTVSVKIPLVKKQAQVKAELPKQPTKPVKPLAKGVVPITKNIIKKAVELKKAAPKAIQPASKPMAKKEETKISVAKPAIEKATAPVKVVADVKAKDIKVPAPKPIVMPKIITKTVRKYQPDFTKSVLDKAERDPGAPTQRYSDTELVEFKELIQRKLEAAKKELSYLHGLITRKDELGGDEGDNRYMTMEDGSLSMEREQLSQMASRQITFIDHLEKAIMRIENKTYGICRVTGKLIDKARLRAVPHATLSIEAKMGAVK